MKEIEVKFDGKFNEFNDFLMLNPVGVSNGGDTGAIEGGGMNLNQLNEITKKTDQKLIIIKNEINKQINDLKQSEQCKID